MKGASSPISTQRAAHVSVVNGPLGIVETSSTKSANPLNTHRLALTGKLQLLSSNRATCVAVASNVALQTAGRADSARFRGNALARATIWLRVACLGFGDAAKCCPPGRPPGISNLSVRSRGETVVSATGEGTARSPLEQRIAHRAYMLTSI